MSRIDTSHEKTSAPHVQATSTTSSTSIKGAGWDNPQLGDVLVLGLGKSGEAVTRYAAALLGRRVTSVTLYGGAKSAPSELTRELEAAGVRLVLGTERVEGHYNLAVASPGISEFSDFFAAAAAASDLIMGEPEFAWRESPECWIGITGTNGKTTTTSLVGALLAEGGLPCACVGNIGELATAAVPARTANEWFACELSSYQLATSSKLHPHVAVLLNVTPDHLKWHRSLEAYAAAKEKIFANLDASDLAIVGSDSTCAAVAARLRARGLRVLSVRTQSDGVPASADKNVAFVRSCALVVRLDGQEHKLCRVDELRLKGEHNVQNALAAAAAALEVGVSDASVVATLTHFGALEHRIEPCGTVGGVEFVNDSKGTNTDASIKALGAFKPGSVVLLAGGTDKGTDLAAWCAQALTSCRAVVCYGEAGPRFAAELKRAQESLGADAPSAPAQIYTAVHLADAFAKACALAEPHNTVLLSPACASFDEFSGFEERGTYFKQLVSDLAAK